MFFETFNRIFLCFYTLSPKCSSQWKNIHHYTIMYNKVVHTNSSAENQGMLRAGVTDWERRWNKQMKLNIHRSEKKD